jgi:hypothetical protein
MDAATAEQFHFSSVGIPGSGYIKYRVLEDAE